jgi:hypothetical protein
MKFAVLGGIIFLSDIYASANTPTRDVWIPGWPNPPPNDRR